VGGWPTSVNAVDVRTCGLGGDSHIQLIGQRVKIGPRRACPVSLASVEHEQVVECLHRLDALSKNAQRSFPVSLADFIVQLRPSSGEQLNWQERAVLDQVRDGPAPLLDILDRMDGSHLHVQGINQLEERGMVQRVGLTPTDLLHAQAKYIEWDAEAAEIATQIVARQLGLSAIELCDRIQDQVIDQLAIEVMGRLLKDENVPDGTTGWDSYLLRRALDGQDMACPVQCEIALKDPLVGLGAPAPTFLPGLAEKLNTTCICPPYAEVGVAMGTVLGQLADCPVE
jgi:N-methylhydantoinase A/oxoprolinase/acetone carboxylase beta subunit